jgi:peptidoglycan/xylan/chitin deacetylase (PgdA/CDA1 family)
MMWGRFANAHAGLGLDFLLPALAQYGFPATFFVEALCADVFGVNGLAEVCATLRGAGHDVQLHLHPNLRTPAWRASGGEPCDDNIGTYPLEEQVQLLERGIGIFERCGIAREEVNAFRAGNYGASNLTWSALGVAGITLDSSLNLCYLDRDCRIKVDYPRVDLYRVGQGVWELPISCFSDGTGYRHLEITAISAAEMMYSLDRLDRAGVGHATIVTHPGEFFVVDDLAASRGRPNGINVRRFRKLLEFLDRRRDRFTVTTVGSLAATLKAGGDGPSGAPGPVPKGSMALKALRIPGQVDKRLATRPRG